MSTTAYERRAKKALYSEFGNATTVSLMPAVFVDNSVEPDVQDDMHRYVRDYTKEVRAFEEEYGLDGSTTRTVPYRTGDLSEMGALGVTYFDQDGKPTEVVIDRKFARHAPREDPDTISLKDAIYHESDHVASWKLIPYLWDIGYRAATTVIEALAGTGRALVLKKQGKHKEAAAVLKKSPYKRENETAMQIEHVYEGPSGSGFKGFVKDIIRDRAAMPSLKRLYKCLSMYATSAGTCSTGCSNYRKAA